MTSQPAEQPTTPAVSSSPTSSPSPTRAGVTAPTPLGVRSTPSGRTGRTPGYSDDSAPAAGPPPSDPLDQDGSTPWGSDDDADQGEGRQRETTTVKLSKRPLRDVMKGGAIGTGEFLHEHLATTPQEQEAGVWLMEDEQAADIADPLAAIATRYAGGAVVDTAVADLIKAGVAIAAYLATNVVKRFKIRRAYKRAGYVMHPDDESEPA